ncbi:NYN domain-containing protein, partial [Candidatus Woesearchaeota archaeon]|nr:NYN domain-containing protein [Candidatus Woesearchaeota archaeon]
AKDLQIFPGGAKKGDWDIGLAMDTIELAPKLDTIVIVSGDGDYVPLVRHLRHALGCRIEVVAFGKSCSGALKDECDSFIDMETDRKRYLIYR